MYWLAVTEAPFTDVMFPKYIKGKECYEESVEFVYPL
jgi:hypothetical protein